MVATHQKTQQGLKHPYAVECMAEPAVATHQKTQQGLKLVMIPLASVVVCRNASENPAGIETCHNPICAVIRNCSRNASENPAGIETANKYGRRFCYPVGRNASENPAGIETTTTARCR